MVFEDIRLLTKILVSMPALPQDSPGIFLGTSGGWPELAESS